MTRVDMPIIKQYFITKHFQVFPHFKTKLSIFLCHWKRKTKSYKCSLTSKTKEQNKKCKKKKSDILFQFLSLDPPYFHQLYLVHFSLILNDFKGYKRAISKSIELS
jgi:hypothetical protein